MSVAHDESKETKLRVRNALFSQIFSRGVRACEQLILVPMFLTSWGAAAYGEWLTMSALAGFIAILNLGISQAATVDIVLQHARFNFEKVSLSFVTSMVMTCASIFLGLILICVLLTAGDLRSLSGQSFAVRPDAATLIALFATVTLVPFLAEPISGILSATRGAALPNTIVATTKVIELLVIALALYRQADPTTIAMVMLGGAIANVAAHIAFLKSCAPWLCLSATCFDMDTLRRLRNSATSFFAIFVSMNVISVQMPRLLVAHSLGPVALAAFSVMVTYTKTARNLSTMVTQAAQVEFARSWANGENRNAHRLINTALRHATLIAAVLLVAEMALAPFAIPRWSNGQVPLDWLLLASLAMVAFAGTHFDGILLAVSAISRAGSTALAYSIGLIIALTAAACILHASGQPSLMGALLLLPEIAGIIFGRRTLSRALLDLPSR